MGGMQAALMGGFMYFTQRFLNLGIVLLSALVFFTSARAQATNCHLADDRQIIGAYRFADGTLVSILPTEPKGHRRITHFNSGKSHKLLPSTDLFFQSGGDLAINLSLEKMG